MLTIVCGLIEEAQCIPQRDDIVVLWGDARNNLDKMVPRGTDFIISFGVSGALDPTLHIGDLIVPAMVVNDRERYSSYYFKPFTSIDYLGTKTGIEYSTGEEIATTPAERQRLYNIYHATAVDDESIHVARFGQQNNIPWTAIRAISDDYQTYLPDWMLKAVDAHGKSSFAEIIKGLEAHPSTAVGLVEVGINFERALSTLKKVAKALWPT